MHPSYMCALWAVMPSSRYGNANNTIFMAVKKKHPHLFDRLTFDKPTKVHARLGLCKGGRHMAIYV